MLDPQFSPSPDASGLERDSIDAIAIVGMALHVPGARTLDQFWDNLRTGKEATTFFSDAQLRAAGLAEATLRDPSYVKAFGVLEGVDLFDAGFFDMPPREAEILDPQHRQLLECAWEALEHAGYAPGSLGAAGAGRIGVMAGVGLNSYLLHNLIGRTDLIDTVGGWQITLGNDKDFAATRVAYKLDLRGAALNVSTACSTSLVAAAMGCQSLLSYQTDMILAGGCSVHMPQNEGYWHHPGGTLSPDGRCRAFDAQAQGTFDGNGAAMVVLKRLDDAIRDGDTIHAVIRGFAINNDGAQKVGYTAPSVAGQSSVIREAQEMAAVGADTIGYVETHGTGTDLGDLVEITALSEAFRQAGVKTMRQCAIGSVKTNVGHLDTAAGATSLIKTVLGLRHGQIAPSLHYTRANPSLGLESSPFYVNAVLREWPRLRGAPRRAGVSSFGIGGTNAHLVLEEAPVAPPGAPGRTWQLLPLSARSSAALQQNGRNLQAHLRLRPAVALADTAFTLQMGRRAFRQRHVVLARDQGEAIAGLDAERGERVFAGAAAEHAASVVFLFPGQDAQYAGMAQTLYRDEPLFRAEVERCAAIVRRTHGIDLCARLFAERSADAPQFASDPLPLFVVEYALARFWMALGVQPRAMLGYSLGEYVCACLAGVLSLEDALTLAIEGARLLSVLAPGPLLAVSMAESTLRPLIAGGTSIAMISAPRQCVVGGTPEAVEALRLTLTAMDVAVVEIPLGLPFHTGLMAPFLVRYRECLKQMRFNPPNIAYVSCVTGDWIRPEQATDPEHYVRVAGQTVRLAQGFEHVFSVPDALFVEMGPGQVMASFLLLQTGRPNRAEVISSLRDPRFSSVAAPALPAPDQLALLSAVAKVWAAGVDIDWSALYAGESRRRVPLPGYAFERQRYWIDPAPPQATRAAPVVGKVAGTENWFYLPAWHALAPLSAQPMKGNWLVVGASPGLASAVAQRLRAAGAAVCLHAEDHPAYADAAFWDTLFDCAQQEGSMFDHIVYLGLHDQGPGSDEALLLAGFYSVLALGQSFGRRVFAESLTLTVVASGVFPPGDAAVAPARAAVNGPLHVMPQEYPNLRCRIIDVATSPLAWQSARLLDQLLAELASGERAVALRDGARWIERFEPYRLAATEQCTFKDGGVYLVTGGLGQVGLALATHIAQRARGVHLVLTSRQAPEALSGARAQQVRAIEALGATVRVARTDVTDEAAMAALVAQSEQFYGAIDGVIHAAGVVGQSSFATVGESSPQFCATQIAPKLAGARVLEKILGERALDFCVLCSSLSPLLGGLGFTAYAAANACLDAFVIDHNRRHPTRWISVNWEGWRFDDEAGGNRAGAAVAELGLLPCEGADAFERILAAPHSDRIVVSTGELGHRIRQWVDMAAPQPETVTVSLHARPAMLGAHVAPNGAVEVEVAHLWQRLLGIDGIGSNDSFFELGGNSLLLTQLLAQIRKAFRLDLSLTSLFENPTVSAIGMLIDVAIAARAHADAHGHVGADDGEREVGLI